MKLQLGAGKHPRPRSEGWVNVDKFPFKSENGSEYQRVDLFAYPWPWEDNSVDEIFSAHLIEHIPHEPKPYDFFVMDEANLERWRQLRDLDGFFAFFAEVWRVCKPGALVELVAPFGYTRSAMQDPTHTRFIVPPTFSYLTAETRDSKDFDYNLPLLFAIEECNISVPSPEFSGIPTDEIERALNHQWDVGNEIITKLRVVKPLDSSGVEG